MARCETALKSLSWALADQQATSMLAVEADNFRRDPTPSNADSIVTDRGCHIRRRAGRGILRLVGDAAWLSTAAPGADESIALNGGLAVHTAFAYPEIFS